MNKKLVSVLLTASTLAWGVGIATLPLANAQTTTSTSNLEVEIASLLAQIQQLQAQLNAAKGVATPSSSYNFTRDLTVGSRGADVSALQQLLMNDGDLNISATTGYFGPLTKAALAKYQAAHGIHPAAGYFGPITRAYIASSSVASTGTGTGTGTGTTGTGTTVTPPATGLSVSLASDNPVAGSLISSSGNTAAARVPVLAVNLTASNSGAVTVTDLKVHKTGVLSDSSISGAYLIQNGQVLYQYTSLNQGVIDFSSMNLQVPAGQTEELWVAIDPSTGLSPGNTVGFAVSAASNVTAVDASNNAITPSGAFPLTGNIFTVTTVSNPSLAGLTINSSAIGTQVTAGTQNNIVGAWQLQGQNSLVYLKGIKFTVIGSANNADIRNVKLNINGTQVGPTLPTVSSNGTAYFNLSSSPASINTGSNNLQVYADVMGSPNKNFQFEILNTYDVYAVDSQYNVPIAVQFGSNVNSATIYQVSIQQGQITVTQDSGTPTGNIASGQSGVTLAKFDIYAAGEPVKVKYLGFSLTFNGGISALSGSVSSNVKNIQLVDDAGGQVGNTINTPPSGNACDAYPLASTSGMNTATSAVVTAVGSVYTDCFGTSGSPINYIVPANTTRVLSLRADIQSGASFSTVVASLVPETGNLQGLTSSAQGNSSGASGSALSLQSSLLSVSKNSAYGNQNVTPNSTNVKIGSYSFTASSASGVQINTVSIQPASSILPSAQRTSDIQNLKVMINGTPFGSIVPTVNDGSQYTFSGAPFTVPAGGTTNVDVYADMQSNASTTALTPATTLTGCSGTSVISFSAVSCNGSMTGQNVTIQTSGATVSVGLDVNSPAAAQLVMGSTGNGLATFDFTETSNIENVKITDLTVSQNAATSSTAYENLTLYKGSAAIGTASASSTLNGDAFKFHFATPPIVPQNGTLVLALKGDVAGYTALGGNLDNTTSTFSVATSSVTALGASSNITAQLTGNATGSTMTVLRSALNASGSSVAGTPPAAFTQIGTLTLSANSAGGVRMNSLKLTFSGSAATTSTLNTVALKDSSGNNIATVDGFATTTVSAGAVTWTFATSTVPLNISAGSSYVLTLWADLSQAPAVANTALNLTASIQGNADLQYYDAPSGSGGSLVSLPANAVPITISSISGPVGGQL